MKYRKLPIVVEAFKWTGDHNQTEDPEWIIDAIRNKNVYFKGGGMIIRTLEGEMRAEYGNYIIKGIAGEIYPCDPDIFEKTYEVVKE